MTIRTKNQLTAFDKQFGGSVSAALGLTDVKNSICYFTLEGVGIPVYVDVARGDAAFLDRVLYDSSYISHACREWHEERLFALDCCGGAAVLPTDNQIQCERASGEGSHYHDGSPLGDVVAESRSAAYCIIETFARRGAGDGVGCSITVVLPPAGGWEELIRTWETSQNVEK